MTLSPRPPRKVLIIEANLMIGGGKSLVLDTATELARRGRYIPIVCNLTGREQTLSQFCAAGIAVHSLAHQDNLIGTAATALALRSLVRKTDADVIHAHKAYAGIYGSIASLGLNIPVICHTQNTNRPAPRRWRWLSMFSAKVNTDLFLAVTDEMADKLLETTPWAVGKTLVLPSAISSRRLALPPDYDPGQLRAEMGVDEQVEFVVGAVGRLEPVKRYDLLLQSFALLQRAVPGAWLVLVGGGQLEAQLRRLAHELGVESRVIFTGYRDDIGPLMSAFDVLVISSQTEAFGIVALEALFCGTPVIMTDTVSSRDILKDATVIVPQDPGQLAEAMSNLHLNPVLRRELGARGRQLVQDRFSISAYVDRLEGLYDSLIARRKGR